MAWFLTSLRQLRAERTAALGLSLLVLVTAFVFGLAPRVIDHVVDRALRDEVAAAPPIERNIQLLQERRVDPGPLEAMLRLDTMAEGYAEQFPPSVGTLIVDRGYQAVTSRWQIVSAAAEEHFATLRFQPGLDDRIELTEGRLPSAATSTIGDWAPGSTAEVAVFEAALAVPSADEVGAQVGDTIRLQLDPTDRLNADYPSRPGPANRVALHVVGLYRVPDPDAAYWLGDAALAGPVMRVVSRDVQFLDVSPLLAPDAYDRFMRLTAPQELPLQYTWRYYVDPTRLEDESSDTVVADLRRLESIFSPSQAATGAASGPSLRSGLLRVVEQQRVGWRSAEAVLAIVAIGPAAVALMALALTVVLVVRRRRSALALQRGRGASTMQLALAAGLEGLVLTGPAAVLAIALAMLIVPSGPGDPTFAAAGVVAIVALLLLVGLTIPASRTVRSSGREAPGRRSGARRLAFEALIVGLAVGGAVLLRSRGVQGASSIGSLASPDPFVAAVPALLGLAAALVAMRAYPFAMRAAAAVAGLRRDLVPALALRQAARGGAGGPTLLVLLTTVALGAFSSATLVHLDRAADAVAWQETGATFRLSAARAGTGLPPSVDTDALPGVTVSAQAAQLQATYAARGIRIAVLAIDAPVYQQVTAGTPVAMPWPIEMLVPTAREPVPVVISSDLADGQDALTVGDVFDLTVEGRDLALRVAEIRPTFPSLAVGEPFAVISIDQYNAALSLSTTPVTTAFLRASEGAADALDRALAGVAGSVMVQGRAQRAAELRESPAIEAVTVGVAVAAVIALAYAGLAVAASLALSGAARAGEMAMLRTLGLTGRQSLGLVVVEHGPTVVVAFVMGTVLGLGLFAVLRPGLGLGTVVGSPLDIPLSVDPGQLLLLLVAIIGIVIISVGLAAALQRSITPADALRRGIE